MGRRASAATLVAFALVAFACTGGAEGPKGGGTVKLSIWAYEGYEGFLGELEGKFEARYPNIDLEITHIPEGQYGAKVSTALVAKSPPDLGIVTPLWLKEGIFRPLDDLVAREGIDLSTYNPGIIPPDRQAIDDDGCAFDGKIYCLGSYAWSVVLFYNKDMFDAAGLPYPSTWPAMTIDQYADTACKLTDPDKGVWGTASGDPITWLPWETFVTADGRSVMGILNGSRSVHAHEVLAGLIKDGCAASANVLDPWEQGIDFFVQKKLAMVVTGGGVAKIESAGIDYGVAPPPVPEGIEPFVNVGTDQIGIFEGAKHVDAAEKFLVYMTTEGEKLRAADGDVPVSSTYAADWVQGIEGRQEELDVMTHARFAVYFPDKWSVVGPLFDAFGFIVSGEKSAREALDEAAPQVQENLDKAWENWDKAGQ